MARLARVAIPDVPHYLTQRGNSTSTTYAYDGADRLTSLAQTLAGSTSVTFGASYSAVSQILSRTSTNRAAIRAIRPIPPPAMSPMGSINIRAWARPASPTTPRATSPPMGREPSPMMWRTGS